ncbi:hypothetical protein BU17DRAFT_70060 [Hysterangium stoloniferum]|nr:hypothetical protein BU17DRAFT_70060 [Hysterangium stoloniferum]
MATFTPPSLDNTLGAGFVGLLISTAQTDGAGIQILVFALCCCISHAMYFYLVRNYGNYVSLLTAVWSIILPVGLNFLHKACLDSQRQELVSSKSHNPIQPLKSVISVVQLVVGLVMMGIGFHLRLFSGLVHFKGVVTGSLGSTALADILIAGCLCYHLYHRKTGFKSTDGVVNSLMIYSINNGLVTSNADKFSEFCIEFCSGKSLNARESLRKERGHIAVDLSANTALPISSVQYNKNNATSVNVSTATTKITQADNSFGSSKNAKILISQLDRRRDGQRVTITKDLIV